LALDGGWLACSRSGDPFRVRGEEAVADFDEVPSGLTSASSVESSLVLLQDIVNTSLRTWVTLFMCCTGRGRDRVRACLTLAGFLATINL
jgi:hypothetical protein